MLHAQCGCSLAITAMFASPTIGGVMAHPTARMEQTRQIVQEQHVRIIM